MDGGRSVVVALDFRATCFMPLPFIEVALKKNRDTFRRMLIEKIRFPHGRSDDAAVLLNASGPLVRYGVRPVGEHEFKFSISLGLILISFVAVSPPPRSQF